MSKRLIPVTLLLILSCVASLEAAPQATAGSCAGSAETAVALTIAEANELLREVGEVTRVRPAPVQGLWLIDLEKDGRKGEAFLDFEKKHLIVGTVFPLDAKAAAPGSMSGQTAGKKGDLAAIPLENSLVMGNPAGTQKIIVFTDPECPYCATLHLELKTLVALEPDLAVYLKMLPLPTHPQAYPKARVILGSGSLEMLEMAFSGAVLPPPGEKDPKQPVADTIRLALSLGINGTPTLIFPDGEQVTGSMDSSSLQNLLALHKKR